MVYKLLVNYTVVPEHVVSGTLFQIQLKITNIGESVFPGGEVINFQVKTSDFCQSTSKSALPKIEPLEQGKSVNLTHSFSSLNGGVASVIVEIKAFDSTEVNLFQNPEFNMGKQWINLLRIFDIETETIINLLKEIAEQLKSRQK